MTKDIENAPNRRMRRRDPKDKLLADEPPRALGVSIAVVAVLLGVAVVAGASMSYQQRIDTTVAIQPDSAGMRGEALLPAQQMVQIQQGQRVVVDLSSTGSAAQLTGQVTGILNQNQEGFYAIRIEFPESPTLPARLQGSEYPATIYTQKIKVFARVFNVFRGLSGR